jgi:hypothetical protein
MGAICPDTDGDCMTQCTLNTKSLMENISLHEHEGDTSDTQPATMTSKGTPFPIDNPLSTHLTPTAYLYYIYRSGF